MNFKLHAAIFTLVYLTSLIGIVFSTSDALANNRGFEMSYTCVTSGPDAGKLIFEVKKYRWCNSPAYGNLMFINNPLYAYGGVSTIYLYQLPGTSGRIDLSPSCYDSTMEKDCYNSSENDGIYEEVTYRSAPVLIAGVPDSNGSEFWVQQSSPPTCINITGQPTSTYFRLVMYPHINPVTNAPDTLGKPGHPSCYDSSPKYAEKVPFLGFLGVTNYHSNQCSDVDGDQLVYSFEPVKVDQFNNYVQYALGFSGQNPFPGVVHNPSNIPLSVNPNTGNFTFTPYGPKGEYLIGHKTTSYRDGQRIAEVFRIYNMILDSLPSDRYSKNNHAPQISFKNALSSTYLPTYADTFAVGQTAVINIKAEDYDSLNPYALQSVSLRLIPQPYQIDPLNPNNCTYIHCAYLDTINPNWHSDKFEDTSVIVANLIWNISCDHLGILNPTKISGVYKTYQFSLLAKDNICPFPLSVIATLSITVHDSTESKNKIQHVEAMGDHNLLKWPYYSFQAPFTYYKVYRSSALSGTYTLLHTLYSINDTSYLDTTSMATQAPYFYKIETAATLGCNPNTNVVRSLYLNISPSGNKARLNWNDLTFFQPTLNTGTYKIYCDTGSGPQLKVSLPFGSSTWLDTMVTCRNVPKYYIDAYDVSNDVRYISNVDSLLISNYKQTDVSICPGDSISIGGIWRQNTGTYYDTVTSALLCDTIIEYTLTMDTVYQVPVNHRRCQGDSMWIAGAWRSQAGIYPVIFQSSKGCDSIINHKLVLNPVYQNVSNKIICSGDSIFDPEFQSYFSDSGQYIKYFWTSLHCDSNYVLNVDVQTVNTWVTVLNNTLTAYQAVAMYQWVDCITGNDIPGATGKNFTATSSGSYKVRITYHGCVDYSECYELNHVGMENNNELSGWKIYPNPNNGLIEITFESTQRAIQLDLIEIHGSVLKTWTFSNTGHETIDLSEYSDGIYILKATTEDSTETVRVVKSLH